MSQEHDQALIKAIKVFDLPGMETALAKGANPDLRMDDTGMTPVIHFAGAAWYDRIAALELLIKYKADVKLTDRTGRTALHAVAKSAVWKSEQVVKILLGAGANIEAEDKFGHRPLHIAVRGWVDHNFPFVLKELLESGADVNAKNKAGFSALDIAVNHQQMPEGKEKIRTMFNRYAEQQQEAQKARRDTIADHQAQLRAKSKKHKWNLKK